MAEEISRQDEPKEIDLLELFSKIFYGLRNGLIVSLLAIYMFVKSYWYYVAGAFVLGVGYTYFTSANGEQSTVIQASFKSSLENPNEVMELMAKFDQHLKEESPLHLAKRTGLDKDYLGNFTGLKCVSEVINQEDIEIYKKTLESSSTKSDNLLEKLTQEEYLYRLEVGLSGTEFNGFDYQKLAEGLAQYFQTNKYVQNHYNAEKGKKEYKIQSLETQLQDLTNLQTKVFNNEKMRSVKVVDQQILISPDVSYAKPILELTEEIGKLKQELQTDKPFAMYTDFAIKRQSRVVELFGLSARLMLWVLIVAFLIETIKWFKKLEAKRAK